MFIPINFWFSNLCELPLNNNPNLNDDTESTQKIYLVSSDENSYPTPDLKDILWRRVNRVFGNSCQWVLNSHSIRYHIAVRISDFYHSDYSLINRISQFLPKNPKEELIRQCFINISEKSIENRKNGNPVRDLDMLFVDTFLSLHNRPLNKINPHDIRLYINFLKKTISDPEAISFLKLHNNLISLMNGIISNSKTSAKLIFSGSLSKLPSLIDNIFLPEEVCKEMAFYDTSEMRMAYESYQQYLPFLAIRENVYKQNDISQYKIALDQQYTTTQFPSVISDLVASYVQYENLEAFLLTSSPKELEIFVSKCMSWLEFFEKLDKPITYLLKFSPEELEIFVSKCMSWLEFFEKLDKPMDEID